jgi:hypothetical protein
VIALATAYLMARIHVFRDHQDFLPIWYSTQTLLDGKNPYTAVGPTGWFYEWPWPQVYPAPAFLIYAPLTRFDLETAIIIFGALSAGLLAYGIARRGYVMLPVFLSSGFITGVLLGQWSLLLAAATLLPVLGFAFAAKPTIAVALFAYRPNWYAVIGSVVITIISLIIRPSWPVEWYAAIMSHASKMMLPVTFYGGPLLLAALLRWKRADARLLVALAFTPQTLLPYETVLLFLLATTFSEAMLLAVLSWVAVAVRSQFVEPTMTVRDLHLLAAQVLVIVMYLPALVLVLRRPNEGDTVELFSRARRWLGSFLPAARGVTS